DVKGKNLQWYDKSGKRLSGTTEIVDGQTYYVADLAGACASEIATVKMLIRDISDQPAADTTQTFTEGETLGDLKVTGVNLHWYADSDKTEELPFTTRLEDSTTYYVTQTQRGLCESQ